MFVFSSNKGNAESPMSVLQTSDQQTSHYNETKGPSQYDAFVVPFH